jgi:hypothetical protein
LEFRVSEDAIEDAVRDVERMLVARQQDPEMLGQEYAAVDQLRLTIDGLQPEKGHETLYAVRQLTLKRVWLAKVNNTGGLYFGSHDESQTRLDADRWPWDPYLREGTDDPDQRNFPGAVNDPLTCPDYPNRIFRKVRIGI